jgi:hypothetical protein
MEPILLIVAMLALVFSFYRLFVSNNAMSLGDFSRDCGALYLSSCSRHIGTFICFDFDFGTSARPQRGANQT